ncbi:hypothetical protein [Methanolacinia paynteri]|uniref:hypothetical protein n=1 Tax=Methanolacinia paynteri TaxID=230356 RepID=UPI00064FA838|nr:hypothetical protein [Methanolacinia paynteri]
MLIVLFIAVVVSAPVSAQTYQNIEMTVDTGGSSLGEIVSVTTVPEIGSYSVTITRGTEVFPVSAGDSIEDGDILVLQRGAYADVSLSDRPSSQMFGGGTDGLAVLFKKSGSSSDSVDEQVKTVYLPADTGHEAGRVDSVGGSCYIQRGDRILPATVGEIILVGDRISCDEGSQVTIEFSSLGSARTFSSGPVWAIERENSETEPAGAIMSLFDEIGKKASEIWETVTGFLSGGKFDTAEPDEGVGVRG